MDAPVDSAQAAVLAGVLLIAVLTVVLGRWRGLTLRAAPLVAITRAAVQLGVLAAVLHGVLAHPWTAALLLTVMAGTACGVAARRLTDLEFGRRAAVCGVLTGAGSAISAVLALHLVAWEARYVIAVAGIVIGNAMSASTLAGRTFLRSVRTRSDEVEGWLALGATPARAHRDLGREAAREAVLPTLDQTRSTGLVTMPGAFVGALFGGASPTGAAIFQLVVLSAVALAMTITACVVVEVAGHARHLPIDAPSG